ncbi:hypothetical protein COS78_04455 [Candidatus Shapirobacteria bacterium CG06_land_8_20_14_3_00_40_12]|uniref:Uncharacterized protein n=2 Tax=Candidatus Shapironibacteriota TaxID=1752721 RepID=A0A2M7TSM1_9BACT|nr:MAG: hypothetical protein COS78_04455 [Candidatus Shapirobacteria bacterium CG06_land_8_20_14_3_00_40_12]PIZ58733.1 MAG: hypothetical protein COY20_03265 [Candidatus Shapirobacteria bacterium CG_4_10_14_0_2_um_filter_40_12]
MLNQNDVKLLEKIFIGKDDLRKELEKLDRKAADRHSKLFDLVDGLAKEIRDSREFRIIISHQLDEVRGRLDTLES